MNVSKHVIQLIFVEIENHHKTIYEFITQIVEKHSIKLKMIEND
jgi:hypothetical protein